MKSFHNWRPASLFGSGVRSITVSLYSSANVYPVNLRAAALPATYCWKLSATSAATVSRSISRRSVESSSVPRWPRREARNRLISGVNRVAATFPIVRGGKRSVKVGLVPGPPVGALVRGRRRRSVFEDEQLFAGLHQPEL